MKELLYFVEPMVKWFCAVSYACLVSFFVPIKPFLVFTTVLVLCDLYTGTKAARHRGEVIHSAGLRRTVQKITLYFIAILLAKGMIVVFGIDFTHIDYIVSGLISVTEFKSNMENISQVTGVDIWAKLVEKFPSLSDYLSKSKTNKDA